MDYILFGFGTGATLALGGWLFRDLGPRIRDRAPAEGDVLSAREMVSRMAWARFCSACGAALALAGIIIMAATIGTAIWNPPDDEGFRIVLIAYATVIVLMLAWTALFLRRFGAAGIIRPREAKPAPFKTETGEKPKVGEASESTQEETSGQPSKTFDELASARGGLGRFAAFFRRDTPSEDTGETRDDDELVGETDARDRFEERADDHDVADRDEDYASEKRLAADDPLVVEVLGEIPEDRVVEPDLEASLVSDLLMPGRDEDVVDDNDSYEDAPESEADDEREELSPEDEALDLLRRKRLARLSGQSDQE